MSNKPIRTDEDLFYIAKATLAGVTFSYGSSGENFGMWWFAHHSSFGECDGGWLTQARAAMSALKRLNLVDREKASVYLLKDAQPEVPPDDT